MGVDAAKRLIRLVRKRRAEQEAIAAAARAVDLAGVTDAERREALQRLFARILAEVQSGELSADLEQKLEALWDIAPPFGRDVIANLLDPLVTE
jgi:hypothetical protein